jgi:choloylglycine hydrolase
MHHLILLTMTLTKKIAALILPVILTCNVTKACTTFFLEKNGQMVFGRNYDWITATGMVNTNLRGLTKTSLPLEKGNTLQWTSKYGSITFNQYGKEFPNGGMNEKGLVVELMWLADSRFPAPDSRPAFSVLQWIQYQLDNCSTIEGVIATDKKLRIANTGTPQHYLVADGNGKVATIEFLNENMVVHTGNDLPYPVLANSTYEKSRKAYKDAFSGSNNSSATFNDNSLGRFATACNMVQQYQKAEIKKPLVNYSFDILNKVSQGNFTQWSIIYDITNKKVYFKTQGYQQLKSFSFKDFDFSCTSNALAFNMNQNIKGEVNKQFITYSNDTNKRLVKQAFAQSKAKITIDNNIQDAMIDLAASFKCN